MRIEVSRGLDLVPVQQPVGEIEDGQLASAAALVGSDCPNVRPTFQVEVGDDVEIGQTLFVDHRRPELAFCAPIGGTVTQIRRGERRSLDIIAVAREHERSKEFQVPELADADGVRRLLLKSGQWPAFRTRPFEHIPDPNAEPAAIFVTATDTEPYSAECDDILRDHGGAFRTGLLAIRNLTAGPIFVCQARDAPGIAGIEGVQTVTFTGAHPAGLPGTHIHHLMPVSRTRQVWHIGCQDLVAIGRLFETGRVCSERVVCVAGPGVREAGRVRTHLGADINDLVEGRSDADDIRIMSGSPLSGRPARYLGRYHTQITVLRQDKAWKEEGLFGRLARYLDDGRSSAIIPTAAHEKAMALDIPPIPLLRALSIGDAENAERLGCLQLAESDVALLSYVCPSKLDYAPLLRKCLDEIETWI